MRRAIPTRLLVYALLTVLALAAVAYAALKYVVARATGSTLSMRACTDPSITQAQNTQPALYVSCGGFLE